MTNKERLAELTLKEATDFNSELVNKSIQTFIDGLTAMQAKQFLDLDGFVEEYDIPIWEDEQGPRDPRKERTVPADYVIPTKSEPIRIANTIIFLTMGAGDMETAIDRTRAAIHEQQATSYQYKKEYWGRIGKILKIAEMPAERQEGSLLQQEFLPILTGAAPAMLQSMTLKDADKNTKTKKATIRTKGGEIVINGYDKIQGGLSTSAKKIFDTARAYLTSLNFYRGESVNPTVEIDLHEYWTANKGEDMEPTPERIKDLKRSIRQDLTDLEEVTFSFTEKRGPHSQDYKHIRFISSHSIQRGKIRINFDIEAARYLIHAFIGQHPTALLRHDNRKPNSYAIGAKIATHNNMAANVAAGTNCTLSVMALLEAAPEIPTIEELMQRKSGRKGKDGKEILGQRNWKDKIKKPLESALDDNMNKPVEYLKKWEYRDPATGKTVSRNRAQSLSWEEYSRLMIDFTVNEPQRKRGEPEEQRGGTRGTLTTRKPLFYKAFRRSQKPITYYNFLEVIMGGMPTA